MAFADQTTRQALERAIANLDGENEDDNIFPVAALQNVREALAALAAPAPADTLTGLYAEIAAERERQDAKWGGNDHDDTHTAQNWSAWIDFIHEHAQKAYSTDDGDADRENFRRRMVEVAALAVAAIESVDRVYPWLNAALASLREPAGKDGGR